MLKCGAMYYVYDGKGKELKAKEDSDKQANGETNGTSSGDAATKAMDEAAKEPKKAFNCYSCGVDCTRSRFHCAKTDAATNSTKPDELKYDLCPNCYFQSRMPSSHRSSDFVKMEDPSYNSILDKNAPWTGSGTLLLEGLEAFDNDWNAASKHVSSQTREECVMEFL
jgi:SWI/SNF related-matrix-associated actin-dependent regulator of chromatin subfamily C